MRALRFVHGTLLALTLALPAFAQPSGETDKAIAFAHEARKLYDDGRWKEALEKFRTAEGMAHSPVLLLYMARCERNLGDLVGARRHYRQVAEAAIEGASPPIVAARSDAEAELKAIEPRIPRLTVRLPKPDPSVALFVDDSPVERDTVLELNPGEHSVEARVGGVSRARRVVVLREGDPLLSVELPLETTPSAVGPGLPLPPPVVESEGSFVPGAIVLSIGGAGLVLGGIMGGLALVKSEDVKSRCVGMICDPADAGTRDDIDTFATVSTVAFIAGGALSATGIVLLIVKPGGETSSGSVALGPAIGGGFLRGQF